MLTRRDFLTRILGAAALAVVPASLLLETKDEALEAARWRDVYRFAHAEAWRILQTKLQLRSFAFETVDGPFRIGERTADGVLMAHQHSVQLKPDGLDGERELSPAMQLLAHAIEGQWLDRLGTIPIPSARDTLAYSETVGPLRLIVGVVFDFSSGETYQVARFDIIGGSTPGGLKVKERRRQALLADRIRARLARPRRVLPLPV